MPYVKLESLPPTPVAVSRGFKQEVDRSERGTTIAQMKSELSPTKRTTPVKGDTFDKDFVIKYPVAKLDVDRIEDATAARLTTSLLGHILFLKGQVPFPVTQLSRIPGGKSNTRAAKQRGELLSSFDTISSHLETTFTALSTALARGPEHSDSKLAQAHLAVIVGPSVTSAKAKVILGIDGLEPRIWGSLADSRSGEDEDDHSEEEDEEEEDTEEEGESSDEGDDVPEDSDEESGDGGEDSDSDEEDDERGNTEKKLPSSSPLHHISFAEQQRFLQTADRILSRTLAIADASGNGIASEISPTQTHILIRAPRGFSHPAWIPRQHVTGSLESSLQDFLGNSGLNKADIGPNTNSSNAKTSKIEGVWITTRRGLLREGSRDVERGANSKIRERTEDDEMIWWSWDGKLVGFSDW